jgi:hypothetical protein
MKFYTRTTAEIVAKCSGREEERRDSLRPLLSYIVNTLGINLVSVRGVEWTEQDDSQLVRLTVLFEPSEPRAS